MCIEFRSRGNLLTKDGRPVHGPGSRSGSRDDLFEDSSRKGSSDNGPFGRKGSQEGPEGRPLPMYGPDGRPILGGGKRGTIQGWNSTLL